MSSYKRSAKSKQQQLYAVMGSRKNRTGAGKSQDIESTLVGMKSGTFGEEGWDIQVVTDIQVKVEGGDGSGRLSGWTEARTPRVVERERERGDVKRASWLELDDASAKDMRKQTSTESLV
jgi:hypothetical protein